MTRFQLTLAATSAILISSALQAAPQYKIIDLGNLSDQPYSYVDAINDAGQIIANPWGPHCYIGNAETGFSNVTPQGWDSCSIHSINNNGKYLGTVAILGDSGYEQHKHFIGDINGDINDITFIDYDDIGYITAINDLGQLTGATRRDSSGQHAFITKTAGSITKLEFAQEHRHVAGGEAINNTGLITGSLQFYDNDSTYYHAFVSNESGMVTDLGTFDGPDSLGDSEGTDINDKGQVVGKASVGNHMSHAFISNGENLIDLGTLAGRNDSRATAINNSGQVIGTSDSDDQSFTNNAFLYDEGTMYALNDLVVDFSAWSSLEEATDINNKGEIIGSGITADGLRHMFLLRPIVNEPLSSNFNQVYLRGTFNNWGTSAMELVADNTWQATAIFSGDKPNERFKFDILGDWSQNYGGGGLEGIANKPFGDDLPADAGAGTYTIRFNDDTYAYTWDFDAANIAPKADAGIGKTITIGDTITIDASNSTDEDGSIESYSWSNGEETQIFSKTFATAGKFNFTVTVTDNEGATSSDTVSIMVIDPMASYSSRFDHLYFRGTNNGWGTSEMVLVADNTWQIDVEFGDDNNERFKFDRYGDWSYNIGDKNDNGWAKRSEGDIAISQAGTYRITINDSNSSSYHYTIEKL